MQPLSVLTEAVFKREGATWLTYTADWYAVTVLDGNLVLLLHLESRGRTLTPADRRLFRDMVASVKRRAAE